eukprot:scaffold5993_cov22-Cyclotella_meneghiniana.AAC.2
MGGMRRVAMRLRMWDRRERELRLRLVYVRHALYEFRCGVGDGCWLPRMTICSDIFPWFVIVFDSLLCLCVLGP